ncbi:MAG TPA: RNA methyltransferase [Pseudonocardiaceae bacterium]
MVAARRLHRRADRAATGRFLVEGARAVRAAAGHVRELFVTKDAAARHPDLLTVDAGRVNMITERAAAALSETVTPQGVFAVCDTVDVDLATGLSGAPRLVAVLAEVADPGNAGTVIRVADAAGADAVLLAGDAVDPHNGKCVRATAGSLFHLPIAVHQSVPEAVAACRQAGLTVLAATAAGRLELDDAPLDTPTAWLFGSEAHGLDQEALAAADDTVRIPIYGRAESLNLATAAAVCLYASARAARAAVRSSLVQADA